MKQSALPFLACPARSGCGGALSAVSLPGLPLRTDGDDLLEGGLCCGKCGTEFPILSGAAILVPAPEDYVRRYNGAIRRDLGRHGELSPEARRWLSSRAAPEAEQADYGADFRFSQQFEDPWRVAQAMAEEPESAFGPFARWLEAISGQGPYDVLAEWAGSGGLLLDAGCGGGGIVARAAGRFTAAFGVDFSLLAVLLARRAVLHRPEAERSYFLPVRRGQEIERPLQVPLAENAEFVVGDCTALPFAAGLFDAVTSSNVIDIAGMEPTLREAARVVRPGGRLLVSDPFYFRDGEAPPGDPKHVLEASLDRLGLTVEQRRDAVPWVWATYDRHWRIYFNYCAAARKR